MLILQRKEGESLLIGDEIEITVLSVEAGRARLAIQAPRSVTILRSELKVAAQTNREAADEEVSPLELLGVLTERKNETAEGGPMSGGDGAAIFFWKKYKNIPG